LHDSGYRIADFTFDALTELHKGDQDKLRDLNWLRQHTMPHGRLVVRFPYAKEAGEAERLAESIEDKKAKPLLNSYRIDTLTLYEVFTGIVKAGRKLGELLKEKEELIANQQTVREIDARRGFIQTARLFIQSVDLVYPEGDEKHEATRQQLLQNLQLRVSEAEKRSKSS